MEALFSLIFYGIVIFGVVRTIKKKKQSQILQNPPKDSRESGAIPHVHETKKYHNRQPGSMPHKHDNKKYHNKESGAMDYDRNKAKYRSMADASQLPKGYILLNGEPVRVADLEGK